MSDLTDPRVVFEMELEAGATVAVSNILTDWVALATALLAYHKELKNRMAVALATSPGTAQDAVYQSQVAKVSEMERFLEVTGDGTVGSLISR